MSRRTTPDDRPVLGPANAASIDAITRLLSAEGLPISDLYDHLDTFLVARLKDEIIGVVGVELHGQTALLRSLCVAPAFRRQRIGQALLMAVEALARRLGVSELYLLTTSAADYFERFGFRTLARELAPDPIRETAQFRTLCPGSAQLMKRSAASA